MTELSTGAASHLFRRSRLTSLSAKPTNIMEVFMADDALKKFEDRLTRLEAALSQRGGGEAGLPPGGAVVDPAPWGGGGGGWGYPYWPHPIVDPAVFHRPGVDP